MSKLRAVIAKILLLLLVFLVLCLADASLRPSLHGDVKVTPVDSKHNRDTLVVHLPGLVADGEWSVRNMTDTWLRLWRCLAGRSDWQPLRARCVDPEDCSTA